MDVCITDRPREGNSVPFEMTQIKELMERYEWPKAVAVTGALGSGKTEWVLNLALGMKMLGEQVTIADADIINPYFCIRQVVNSLEEKGFKVMEAELTEVLRQSGESVILKNAMQIRNLLEKDKRNRLVFEEKANEVEVLEKGELLEQYLSDRKKSNRNNSVVICFTNQGAYHYNKEIRESLYGTENPDRS